MRKVVMLAALFTAAAVALVAGVGTAGAYGGDGQMGVYQIGVSFNCDNRTLCGSDNLGGFWGWLELDNAARDGLSGPRAGERVDRHQRWR